MNTQKHQAAQLRITKPLFSQVDWEQKSLSQRETTGPLQFVVIEQVAATPSLPSEYDGTGIATYTQVRINTTEYFLKPDNIPNDGVNTAAPYPRSVAFQPSFNLYPDIYVLPQVFDVLLVGRGKNSANAKAQVFVKYTLYDNPDALIANKPCNSEFQFHQRMLIGIREA